MIGLELVRVKHLDPRLVAFTLNVSDDRAQDILRHNAEPNPEEAAALYELEYNLNQIAYQRAENQIIEWGDIFRLGLNTSPEGKNIFTEIRAKIGADEISEGQIDAVERSISKLAFESFPFALLNVNPWGFDFGRRELPQFVRRSLLLEFMNAVRGDESLMKLFPDGAPNEFSMSTQIFTSFGTSSSVYLHMLHENIIRAAIGLMQLRSQCSPRDLQLNSVEMLNILRKVANGETAYLPVIDVFDLVGIPKNAEITVQGKTLRSIPRDFHDAIPPSARPAIISEQASLGCMLVRKAPFSVLLAQHESEFNPEAGSPIEITVGSEKDQVRVSLVTALAINDDVATAARFRSTISIDPINGISRRWTHSKSPLGGHHLATEEECIQLDTLFKNIESLDLDHIQVAIKRYISAVINRSDFHDSLIDAVIGLESLFGGKSEITFQVSAGVSALLGKSNTERKAIFEEVKKFYNARSSIVHGDQSRLAKLDIPKERAKAVKFLKRCLLKLVEDRNDLLGLKSDARVQKLVLEEK
ncbi:HEPN domain-containing protein [Rhizobium oryzicola]|uniref:HEPN domain-containing protein n=1 Tax=Rhizobium oryzicola TaxID=1232668 RepID=A0ABT8SV34_9HYPH|nr:HEPN domain-containing protein [Rhizobium oryzicola]MDO1582196.1 HEPN domain-containing protein [Rhizobium oryzicola]